MQKILESYKDKICANCKADCYTAKGIVVVKYKDILHARCVDYLPGKKKIEGYKKPKEKTAKHEKMVMPQLAMDWGRR